MTVPNVENATDLVLDPSTGEMVVSRPRLQAALDQLATPATTTVDGAMAAADKTQLADHAARIGELEEVLPGETESFLNLIRERGAVTVWSTRLPARVTLVDDGREVDDGKTRVVTSLWSDERLECDAAGRLARPVYPGLLYVEGDDYTDAPSYVAPSSGALHHVHAIGQSYAQGLVDARESTAAAHAGVALMLDAGVFPLNAPAGGFADLVAGQLGGADYEPPVVAAANGMVGGLEAALGQGPAMLASVSAFGGRAYHELMRGSSRWGETRRIMEAVRREARALGLRPELSVLMIHEGEQDAVLAQSAGAFSGASGASVEMAVGHIMRWRQDHEDLAREIYGQSRPPVAVLYSTNRSYFAGPLLLTPWQAACREAARRAPHLFVVAGPVYGVEHQEAADVNPFHPTATGCRRLGEMMGRAALAAAYSTGFQPLDVIEARWVSATEVRLRCHVPWGGSLAIDASGDIVGDVATTRGFAAETAAGAVTVSAVSVSGDEITLTLGAGAVVGGTRIAYAVRGTSGTLQGDNSDMARGVIRGSVAHPLSGSAVSSHDWLLPFSFIM